MTPELEALVRHRLVRARETLSEADLLLKEGTTRGAVNRLYYAAFYAARSLLATKRLDSAKHSGVITLFQREFVKTGAVTPERAKALSRAFEKRQKTDYADFVAVSTEDARTLRGDVAAFVDECERAVERLLAQA